ncbi:hypothetical protein D3C72_2441860 [compost metagenome]
MEAAACHEILPFQLLRVILRPPGDMMHGAASAGAERQRIDFDIDDIAQRTF